MLLEAVSKVKLWYVLEIKGEVICHWQLVKQILLGGKIEYEKTSISDYGGWNGKPLRWIEAN